MRLSIPSLALGLAALTTSAAYENFVVNEAATLDGYLPAQRIRVPSTAASFASEVVRLTNIERTSRGLGPLIHLAELDLSSSYHVEDQKDLECLVLSHVGSDGSTGLERILRTGLLPTRWAENIACGYLTPEAVMVGWMNSPGHRGNILDPLLTHMGSAVGASDSDGTLYWVQNFATL